VATWRKRGSRHITSSRLFESSDIELRARLVTVERRLLALRALIHLLLVLVRVRGARLVNDRLPDGQDKEKLLLAISLASKAASRRRALALVGLTEARFRAWTRRQGLCTLDDRLSCPKHQPRRLNRDELSCMRTMAESVDFQHMPVSVLSVHAKRIRRVFASASTWARMMRKNGWRRPRKRILPRPSRIGIRAQRIGELLHIDVTVIRLLDGSKVFVQAVIDNFSRRILAWRISPTLESARTASILRDAVRVLAERGAAAITLMADSGVENINGTGSFSIHLEALARYNGWWFSTSSNTTR
jgi:putative transposase